MGFRDLLLPVLTLALAAAPAAAHDRGTTRGVGRLVWVSVERRGEPLPLYAAPDGSSRRYLEARKGEGYAVRLTNRTPRRLGVELRVDGLDVISGQAVPDRGRGRLYVLEPWGSTLVRGWRSSLDEIHRFTFVDETRSYAARRREPAARLGWIEARVFEERRPEPRVSREHAAPRDRASAPSTYGPEASAEAQRRDEPAAEDREGYPGTGWGRRVGDRAVVVEFDAAAWPAEEIALRYEYRSGLRLLGILRDDDGHRLRERERGEPGFAPPPRGR